MRRICLLIAVVVLMLVMLAGNAAPVLAGAPNVPEAHDLSHE
jgi:hypothetical protein